MLVGGDGDDWLRGGLQGGVGADRMQGGEGHDSIAGGEGADVFVLASAAAEDSDEISISRRARTGSCSTTMCSGSAKAPSIRQLHHRRQGRQRRRPADLRRRATGNLFFDSDGTGAGAQILIARLTGAPAITASDIIVI